MDKENSKIIDYFSSKEQSPIKLGYLLSPKKLSPIKLGVQKKRTLTDQQDSGSNEQLSKKRAFGMSNAFNVNNNQSSKLGKTPNLKEQLINSCGQVFDHIMHNEIYDLSNESSATTELNPIIGVLTRENIFSIDQIIEEFGDMDDSDDEDTITIDSFSEKSKARVEENGNIYIDDSDICEVFEKVTQKVKPSPVEVKPSPVEAKPSPIESQAVRLEDIPLPEGDIPLPVEVIPLPQRDLPEEMSLATKSATNESVTRDMPVPNESAINEPGSNDQPIPVKSLPNESDVRESVANNQFCPDTSLPDYFNVKPILKNVIRTPELKSLVSNFKRKDKPTQKERKFPCPDCDASFVAKNHMERHYNSIHKKYKAFKCTECDFSCTDSCKLKRHMLTHTDSGDYPFKCDKCYYRCKLKDYLTQHTKMVHNKERNFQCTQCDDSFVTKAHLQRHCKLMHENAFKCPECTFSCNTEIKMKYHELTHKGETCFRCEWCTFTSEHYSKFVRHQLVHKDERPFKCKICDFKCSLAHNLKTHENAMHPSTSSPADK